MIKKEFSVGVTERHHVVVTVSTWTGSVRVMVDGKEVPETGSSVFAPDFTLPTSTFTFGERERHVIEVKFEYPFAFSRALIYLDGAPLQLAPL